MRDHYLHLDYAPELSGVIAGFDAGVTQVEGKVSALRVCAFEITPALPFVKSAWARADGHYLLNHLDPERRYLIIARSQTVGYQPDVYDHLKPADLSWQTVVARMQAWESTKP